MWRKISVSISLNLEKVIPRVPLVEQDLLKFVLLNLQFSVKCFIYHCLSSCDFSCFIVLSVLRIRFPITLFDIYKLFLIETKHHQSQLLLKQKYILHVIVNETKVLLSQTQVTVADFCYQACLGPLACFAPIYF